MFCCSVELALTQYIIVFYDLFLSLPPFGVKVGALLYALKLGSLLYGAVKSAQQFPSSLLAALPFQCRLLTDTFV